MRILAITDGEEGLEEFFDDITVVSLDQVAPKVKNRNQEVKIAGDSVDEFDAAYTNIPVKNAVFGRIMLEMMDEEGLKLDISSTAFFTAAKKNYLYYVLQQKGVNCPKTVSLASEKATRGIERNIKGPVVARRFEELEEVEGKKLETVDAIHGFAEGVEYGDEFILFQEYSSGDKHRCLKIGDKIISLREGSDSWKFDGKNLKYSNISAERKELVNQAADALGAEVLEVRLRGDEVFDVNPKPDFQMYESHSGQDIYGKLMELLEEGGE